MEKLCIKCLTKKDIKEFNDSSNTIHSVIGTCKSCLGTYNAAYYRAHKEQVLNNQRRNRQLIKERK